MFLGYVLLCGLSPTTPGTIGGCRAFTQQFPTAEICEQARVDFFAGIELAEGVYEDAHQCLVIGTEV